MSNEKQTAVDWLTKKLWDEFGMAFSNNILEQAKSIEKQQIVEARNTCKIITKSNTGKINHEDLIADEYWTSHLNSDGSVLKVNVSSNKDGEQYYSQTYKQ